ncbi:MAG: ATP-dependent protease subunit HslV [Acidobacteriota bacterium]
MPKSPRIRSTTILSVRHRGRVAMVGDGQVTLQNAVMKRTARKIRVLGSGKVLAGFAGTAADAFTLFTRFEAKLEQYRSNLQRAAVELVQDWRTDRVMRRLEALLIVADSENSFLLSGTGDLISPDDGLLAIGSGGTVALAAAKALVSHSDLPAERIAEEAMRIAASIDIYTNDQLHIEALGVS